MSDFYIKRDTQLDIVADADGLAARSLNMASKLSNIVGVKQEHDQNARITNWGRQYGGVGEYKHVARIPDGLMSALLAVKPDFLVDRKGFHRWLQRHPEFAAYKKE